ncbi:succinate dehydrogenase, hydrophobic membrane anchor protein [Quisquiliibacterium transsilvanicum]|uniref:Succinate dehydrogenase hydrophobic membrane anchor subunit n=1 Tax=Quisquiliibacterium transsilvanicum TaxID=1549638 RepID=A0A7W8MA88_9BURK|nr:succinate dehydrogenase, hydrophobic membrane anchor protein [Quisquiliibacterium transsilvanicum]MBB5272894.1 succinate dehydrogenase / fumarate reductase membrane anchor subunit [Quisquiliibacterium transsilvanicum]
MSAGADRLMTGLRAWTLQRASALYLLGFMLVLALRLLADPVDDHARWVALWRSPWMASGALLAVAALAAHAWVGARDVVLDYVRPAMARPVVLAAIAVVLGLTVLRLAAALLRVGG